MEMGQQVAGQGRNRIVLGGRGKRQGYRASIDSIAPGHCIQFHNTSILATKTQDVDRIVTEAIEFELHPNNMNREVGFCLSKSWKPLICSLKKPPDHDARSTRLRRFMHAWQLSPGLTGAAQIEETAMQLTERLRNSTSGQRNMSFFSQLCCHVVS
jgi:hypothetical protein